MNLFLKIFTVCLFSVLFSQYVQAGNIVATVNEHSITDVDVKKRSDLVIFSSGLTTKSETYEAIKPKIINILIDEKLIEQEAERLQIILEDKEIDDSIEILAEKNHMSLEELDKTFKIKKIDRNELENQLKYQILLNKIIRNHISNTIHVSDKEINESRVGIQKLAVESHSITDVKLVEILLSLERKKSLEIQINMAKQLITQIRAGADFGKIARQFSDSASSINGGDIGWIPMSQITPELANVLFKVKVGDVSEPILLQDGIHIIKVTDRKLISDEPKTFTDDDIKEILMNKKLNAKIRSYLMKMHSKAYIKIN
jgi:peptidyl-prolyl cis-trans isomerase SurA